MMCWYDVIYYIPQSIFVQLLVLVAYRFLENIGQFWRLKSGGVARCKIVTGLTGIIDLP